MMTTQEKGYLYRKQVQARTDASNRRENVIPMERPPRASLSTTDHKLSSSDSEFEEAMRVHLNSAYPFESTANQNPGSNWLWDKKSRWPSSIRSFGFRYMHETPVYNVKIPDGHQIETFSQALRKRLQIPHGLDLHQSSVLREKCFTFVQTNVEIWIEKGLLVEVDGQVKRCPSFKIAWEARKKEWHTAIQKSSKEDKAQQMLPSPRGSAKRDMLELGLKSSRDNDRSKTKRQRLSITDNSAPQRLSDPFHRSLAENEHNFVSQTDECLQQPSNMALYQTNVLVQPNAGFFQAQPAPVANMGSPQELQYPASFQTLSDQYRSFQEPLSTHANTSSDFCTQSSLNTFSENLLSLPDPTAVKFNIPVKKSQGVVLARTTQPANEHHRLESSFMYEKTTTRVSEVNVSLSSRQTFLLAPPFEFDDIRNRQHNVRQNNNNNNKNLGSHINTSLSQQPPNIVNISDYSSSHYPVWNGPKHTNAAPNPSMESPQLPSLRSTPAELNPQQIGRTRKEPSSAMIPPGFQPSQPKLATALSSNPKNKITLSFIIEASKGEPNLANPLKMQEFKDATRTQFIDLVVARRTGPAAADDILRVQFIHNWGNRSPTLVYNRCTEEEWERKRDEVRRKCEFRRDVLKSRGLGGDLTVWVEVDLRNAVSAGSGEVDDVVEEEEWE